MCTCRCYPGWFACILLVSWRRVSNQTTVQTPSAGSWLDRPARYRIFGRIYGTAESSYSSSNNHRTESAWIKQRIKQKQLSALDLNFTTATENSLFHSCFCFSLIRMQQNAVSQPNSVFHPFCCSKCASAVSHATCVCAVCLCAVSYLSLCCVPKLQVAVHADQELQSYRSQKQDRQTVIQLRSCSRRTKRLNGAIREIWPGFTHYKSNLMTRRQRCW